MPKNIKVGLITHGVGAHVGAYLTALAQSDACREVVLVDPDKRWNGEAKKTLGGKLTAEYTDHRRMLSRERPEMALITLEAKLAPPVIDAALEAECHVFAEKPACLRPDDFAPLVQKADAKHRFLMLALANRTNPEMAAARKLVADGAIGKVFALEMHLIADQTRLTRPSYHESWFARKDRAGGGHLLWLGIHWLDLAMYITQSDITRVAGFTANVGGQPIDVEDSAAAALQFSNGSLGTVTSGYYLDRGYHSHIKIWGSSGWLHLKHMTDVPLQWYSNEGEQAGKVQTWDGSKEPRGYSPFVDEAVKACAEMSEPPISSADSLRALRTVFGVYTAATTGKSAAI